MLACSIWLTAAVIFLAASLVSLCRDRPLVINGRDWTHAHRLLNWFFAGLWALVAVFLAFDLGARV